MKFQIKKSNINYINYVFYLGSDQIIILLNIIIIFSFTYYNNISFKLEIFKL